VVILICVFQDEDAFLTHVEDEINDAEIRKESVSLLENLIIGNCCSPCIHKGRTAHVVWATLQVGLNIKKFTALEDECLIEVYEKLPMLFVERAEIILKILKEGRVEVGGLKCIPMLMLPVAMSADANVFHQTLATRKIAMVNRNGKVKFPVWRVDGTAIANGLLREVLVLLYENRLMSHELCKPTDWREICAWKYHVKP